MRAARSNQGASDRAVATWIAPGTALTFSVIAAWLSPHYPQWFGPALPWATRVFLTGYPMWIALSTAALFTGALATQVPVTARWKTPGRWLDAILTGVSILVIAFGLIALFLPVLVMREPG